MLKCIILTKYNIICINVHCHIAMNYSYVFRQLSALQLPRSLQPEMNEGSPDVYVQPPRLIILSRILGGWRLSQHALGKRQDAPGQLGSLSSNVPNIFLFLKSSSLAKVVHRNDFGVQDRSSNDLKYCAAPLSAMMSLKLCGFYKSSMQGEHFQNMKRLFASVF